MLCGQKGIDVHNRLCDHHLWMFRQGVRLGLDVGQWLDWQARLTMFHHEQEHSNYWSCKQAAPWGYGLPTYIRILLVVCGGSLSCIHLLKREIDEKNPGSISCEQRKDWPDELWEGQVSHWASEATRTEDSNAISLSLIRFSLSIGFLYSLCRLWLMYISWNMVAKSAWVSHLTTLQRNSFAITFSERNLGKRFGHQVSNFGQTNHGQEVVHSVWFNCLLWTERGYQGNWLLVERQLRKVVPRRKRDAFVRREYGGYAKC